jgi:hypothetical protein
VDQGVSFRLLQLKHLPLIRRLDIALRLGLVPITTPLAKVQLPILHIGSFQFRLKLLLKAFFQQVRAYYIHYISLIKVLYTNTKL